MPGRKLDPYSGFLLAFEPLRTADIVKALKEHGVVAESFSKRDWTFEQREIAFLVLHPGEPSIGAATLMQPRGGSGGTSKRMMGFSDAVRFDPPVLADEVQDIADLRALVSNAGQLRRMDPITWLLLIERIGEIRP